jgi:hypothetical protein
MKESFSGHRLVINYAAKSAPIVNVCRIIDHTVSRFKEVISL